MTTCVCGHQVSEHGDDGCRADCDCRRVPLPTSDGKPNRKRRRSKRRPADIQHPPEPEPTEDQEAMPF